MNCLEHASISNYKATMMMPTETKRTHEDNLFVI